MRHGLVDAIRNRPERQPCVTSMHHEHHTILKRNAAAPRVAESRVCQRYSQCIARLGTRLREW